MVEDTSVPRDLYYSTDHVWVLVEDKLATFGLTDYGQIELGEVVYVDLTEIGTEVDRGTPFGTIEAMKAVAELMAPVSGKVIEINETLESDPRQVNRDPYGEGWLIRVQWHDQDDLDSLLTPQDYQLFISGEGEDDE